MDYRVCQILQFPLAICYCFVLLNEKNLEGYIDSLCKGSSNVCSPWIVLCSTFYYDEYRLRICYTFRHPDMASSNECQDIRFRCPDMVQWHKIEGMVLVDVCQLEHMF